MKSVKSTRKKQKSGIMIINIFDDIQANIQEHVNVKGHKTFTFHQLQNTDSRPIIMELDIYNFIELLNSFVSNQLITGKVYKHRSYTFKLVSHKKVVSLLFEFSDKKYYLEKFDARVFSQKLNKILSRCTLKEFL